MREDTTAGQEGILPALSAWGVIALAFLLPFFFIPSASFPPQFSKSLLLFLVSWLAYNFLDSGFSQERRNYSAQKLYLSFGFGRCSFLFRVRAFFRFPGIIYFGPGFWNRNFRGHRDGGYFIFPLGRNLKHQTAALLRAPSFYGLFHSDSFVSKPAAFSRSRLSFFRCFQLGNIHSHRQLE